MQYSKLVVAGASVLALSACAQPGANLQANVYQANQVNQAQRAEVVDVLAVLPAKIEVSNAQEKAGAQVFGALLGAAAGAALGGHFGGAAVGGALAGGAAGAVGGSLVPGQTLVAGVSLTYTYKGETLNSAQVGQLCQFKPGNAIMVSTGPSSTRIQPNASCPVTKKS